MSRDPYFAGLDIGTTEVRCVVGRSTGQNAQLVEVIGVGVAKNRGSKKGVVFDKTAVAASIGEAVQEASRMSGVNVRRCTININGAHVKAFAAKGIVAVSGAKGVITDSDRDRAEDSASKSVKLPGSVKTFQLYPRSYSVDGQGDIKDPVGVSGSRLEADVLVASGSVSHMSRLDELMKSVGLVVNDKVVSSLAAAEALLDQEARQAGSVVVDIGHSTTNVLVMKDGEIAQLAVIPVGGAHVTNDLAIGLKTAVSDAEFIKREYVNLARPNKFGVRRDNFGNGEVEFSLEDLDMIVASRLEELCEQISHAIDGAKMPGGLAGGLVLTGGGSRLQGLEVFMSNCIGSQANIGQLVDMTGQVSSVNRPQYAVATGLMVVDLLGYSDGGGRLRTGFGAAAARLKKIL